MGISIDVIMAVTALISQLTNDYQNLRADDWAAAYKVHGFRHEQVSLIKALDSMTFREASGYCRDRRMNVFQVYKNFYLSKVFNAMEVTEVWTPLVRSREIGTLMDNLGFSPPIATKDTTISMAEVTLTTMVDDTSCVTLRYKDGAFGYVTTHTDQKKAVVCLNNLSFPFREIDILVLSELKNTMINEMERKINNLEIKKKWLMALWQNIPKLPKDLEDETLDVSSNMTDLFFGSLTDTGLRFINLIYQVKEIRA